MAFVRGIAITSHDVVTRALHATRSEDFGDMSWSEPLEVLTRSLDREARLTHAGRKLARDVLVDVLVARHHAAAVAAEVAATGTSGGSDHPRVVAALDGAVAVSAAAAAVGRSADHPAWLDLTFLSLAFEERWHVPSYAEWLAEADVAGPIVRTLGVVAPPIAAGALLLEHLGPLAAARVTTEVVPCEVQAAVEATARRSVALRRVTSDDVDADRVTRYWAWRLGLVDERFRAGTR